MVFLGEPYRVLRNLYLQKIACGRALAYVRACAPAGAWAWVRVRRVGGRGCRRRVCAVGMG